MTPTPTIDYWVANWSLSRAQAAVLLNDQVADMIDCTHDRVDAALQSYPSIKRFAGYITGTPDIRWLSGDWARIPVDCATIDIDQSASPTPTVALARVAVDTETGASVPTLTASVARERFDRGLSTLIYVDQAELGAVEEEVARVGLPAGRIVAYQWASPTSNPNLTLPGGLTVAQANVDLSVILTAYLPLPSIDPAATGTFRADLAIDLDGQWSVHGAPSDGVILGGPDEWQEVKVGVNRKRGTWRAEPLPAEGYRNG